MTFEICHELYSEGKHLGNPDTYLRSNLMVTVKFPIRVGTTAQALSFWPAHNMGTYKLEMTIIMMMM